MSRRLQKILILVTIFGCSRPISFIPGSAEKSNRPSDGRRPTEEGEGVLGYLRDPADVSIDITENWLVIHGRPSAVIGAAGAPLVDHPICVFQVPRQEIADRFDQQTALDGMPLTKGLSDRKGGFSLSSPVRELDAKKSLVVDVSGTCGGGALPSGIGALQRSLAIQGEGRKDFVRPDQLEPEPLPGDSIQPIAPISPPAAFASKKPSDTYLHKVSPRFVDKVTGQSIGPVMLYFLRTCFEMTCAGEQDLGEIGHADGEAFFVRGLEVEVKVAPENLSYPGFPVTFRTEADWNASQVAP